VLVLLPRRLLQLSLSRLLPQKVLHANQKPSSPLVPACDQVLLPSRTCLWSSAAAHHPEFQALTWYITSQPWLTPKTKRPGLPP